MITKTESLLKSEAVFNLLLNDEEVQKNIDGYIDTFNNCRETGFVLRGFDDNIRKSIWVYEHRNGDEIVVSIGNTKDVNNIFDEETYKNGRTIFEYNEIYQAYEYIKGYLKNNYFKKTEE